MKIDHELARHYRARPLLAKDEKRNAPMTIGTSPGVTQAVW